jgi:hypothetical protein
LVIVLIGSMLATFKPCYALPAAPSVRACDVNAVIISSSVMDLLQTGLALQTLLSRTDHIHAAVILTTCNAKILIDHLASDLAKLEGFVVGLARPSDQLVTDVVSAHLNLSALIGQYDGRLEGIRQALDRGRDMLPLNEFRP